MAEKLIQCPKDPRVAYRKEVCETIFRKDKFRTWCKMCPNFMPCGASAENA